MSAPDHAQTGTSRTGDVFVRTLGMLLWENLTPLLVIDLALVFAALPSVLLAASGAQIAAPIVAIATIGPAWAGAVATSDRLWFGRSVSPAAFVKLTGRFARTGVACAAPPLGILAMLLGTLSVFRAHPGERWLMLPLLADVAVGVLVATLSLSTFSLAATGGLPLKAALGWALKICARDPLATLGLVSLGILIWVAGQLLGPAAIVLAASPFSVCLSAVTWRGAGRLGGLDSSQIEW